MLSAYLASYSLKHGYAWPLWSAIWWDDLLILSLIAVSLSDVTCRRVSNGLSLTALTSGVLFWGLHIGSAGLHESVLGALLCFGTLLVLYCLGMVGAADVKVFAAYGAWVGSAQVSNLALFAGFFAGLMGVVALYQPGPWAVWRMFQAVSHPAGAMARARKKGQTMPLTLAFSVSVYWVMRGGLQ